MKAKYGINSFNYYYRLAKNEKHTMDWISDLKKYVVLPLDIAIKIQKVIDLEIIYKPMKTLIFIIMLTISTIVEGQAWYNPSWLYRKAITINSSQVGTGPHTNFPVLINSTIANLTTKALANGNDILFTSSDGITKLNHEIESFVSATGALVAWVKIPTLISTANTVIYMYYGNALAPNQQNVNNTWNANYKGVYHLNSNAVDATVNANNGTVIGALTYGAAKIANGGVNFSTAGTRYISIPGLMGSNQNTTISAWGTLTARDAVGANIISIGDYLAINVDDITDGYEGVYYNAGWGLTKSSPTLHPVSTGWHYFAYTFNNTAKTQTLYMDGVVVGSGTYTNTINYSGLGTNTYIGKNAGGSNNFDFAGRIDEVRVSNTTRSTTWILTEYNNQNSPSTFYSIGVEEDITALPIELVYFDAKYSNNSVLFSWMTASEINNNYFTIEQSTDGINFIALTNVSGAGNSTSIKDYSYTQENPLSGVNYYRLRQTDYDSKNTTSDIINVNVNNEVGSKIIRIINMQGEEVKDTDDGILIYFYDDGSNKKYYRN